MLETGGRILLTEALAPPGGHQVEILIGTTYSLQLSALLGVPLGLTFADWETDEGEPTPDPIASLEAVRRHADRVTVFCQAGATAVTEQPPLVASWIEDVVVPVKAPFEGVFHPKVWVARYAGPDGELLYRVVCGSRNLTFDRCWDTVAVVEGQPSPRGRVVEETTPLAEFVTALPGLASASVDPVRLAAIEALAGELRRVRFSPPTGFEGLGFHPLGIHGHTADPFAQHRRTRTLTVSPFLGARRLKTIGGGILISRADELDRLSAADLVDFDPLYVLDEPQLDDGEEPAPTGLSGLHAKAYIADDGWNAHVWTGSANATSAAFKRNVEFLLRLDGKKAMCGVDAALGAPGTPERLEDMLLAYEPREEALEPDPQTELDCEADHLLQQLCERRFVARVSETVHPDLSVDLLADATVDQAAGVQARGWPLTGIADRDARPLDLQGAPLATFGGQALASVTAFYVVELTLERDGLQAGVASVVRADLEGVPDGRREAILRDLLRDPEQVMRLLRALLSFDADSAALGDGLGFIPSGGSKSRGSSGDAPMLELLLRALEEAPTQLDAIAELLDDLGEVDGLLPAELLEIWEPIRRVHEELKR